MKFNKIANGLFIGALVFILGNISSCRQESVNKNIILATTTSFKDSGLLDVLLPVFEKESGYKIKPIAVGSGEAMAMGKQGNADVLLVHSPAEEEEFMNLGFGQKRLGVMHNDFVIVGPTDDPAGVKSAKTVVETLTKITAAKTLFVSRADQSGTHKKELKLWAAANIKPEGAWYIQASSGMANVLQVANQKQAYTLTDRGTYLALKKRLDLVIVFEGDPGLINYYSVIVVNHERFPKTNLAGAEAFAAFLVSERGKKLIHEFGVDESGRPLFTPE